MFLRKDEIFGKFFYNNIKIQVYFLFESELVEFK